MTTLILLSGGLDSTVLAAYYADRGEALHAVSVDYGQRHARELEAAQAVAAHYGARHDVLDLTGLGALLSGSALTDPDVPVPDGHYAEESMKATIVPNRNMIMLSAAAGIALAHGYHAVATAVHAGDHYIYPDCRPEFIAAVNDAVTVGMAGIARPGFTIEAPFITNSKADIARLGTDLGAPLHLTWSCYKGGEVHCGRCGTCVERAGAFADAGVADPTVYADTAFAPKVLAEQGF
jgi:7-cyano-7-deazaguanine synthase